MELTEHPLNLAKLWNRWKHGGRIQAVFQPIVSLQNGSVHAYEALSRPIDREGESVPILALIASADRHRQLATLDRMAYTAMLSAVQENGWTPDTYLFINVVPRSVADPGYLLHLIQHHPHLSPNQIVLEISERETLDAGDAHLSRLLQPFRDLGVKIALDDLGAGYSGLNRLVELKPDFAKIDLSLIRDVDRNSIKLALVESTVRFASKTAAIEIIAEGIETPSELFTLQEIGVDYGQGYLLGRPRYDLASISHRDYFHRPMESPVDQSQHLQALLNTAQRMVQGMAQGVGRNTHLVRLAMRLLGADVVSLFRRDQSRLELHETTLPASQRPPIQDIPIDADQVTSLPLIDRNPYVHQTLEDQRTIWAQQIGLESGVTVPICDNHDCWGVMHIGFYAPHRVRPDMVKLAEGLAHLFVLAIGFSTPADTMAVGVDPLGEPLFEAIATLADTEDVQRLVAKVVQGALAVSEGHEGWIGLLDHGQLHCIRSDASSFDVPQEDLFDPNTIDGQGPVGQILQTGRQMMVPDIVLEPTLAPWLEDMLAAGIKSALGIPLLVGSRVIGILKVYHSEVGGFTLGRVRRLQALASLATTLLEKSLTLKDTQEEQFRQEQLTAALFEISTCTTEEQILETVSCATRRMTGAELVVVSETEGQKFRHRAASGDRANEVIQLSVPLNKASDASLNLLSQVFYQRTPATRNLENTPKALDNPPALSAWARQQGLVHVLGLPLSSHDETLGVLTIFQKSSSVHPSVISDITSFAHAAASALYDRRLMHLLQAQQKQVDVLMRASSELPLIPDVDQLWQRTGDILTQTMGVSGGFIIEDPARLPSLHTFGMVRTYEGLLQQLFQESDPRRKTPEVQSAHELDQRLRDQGVKSCALFPMTLHGQPTEMFVGIHSTSDYYFNPARLQLIEAFLGYVGVSYEVIHLRDQDRHALITEPLTKIANRHTIQRCFNGQSQKMREGVSSSVAIALLDLDDFSHANADHGYTADDPLLQEVAHAIHRTKDADAMLGRLGSDGFVILYRNRQAPSIQQEMSQIQRTLPHPMRWSVVWCNQGTHNFSDLLHQAYQCLSSGGGVVEMSW